MTNLENECATDHESQGGREDDYVDNFDNIFVDNPLFVKDGHMSLAEIKHNTYIKNRNKTKEAWIMERDNLRRLYMKTKFGRQYISCYTSEQTIESQVRCVTCEKQYCCHECFPTEDHSLHCLQVFIDGRGWVKYDNPDIINMCQCSGRYLIPFHIFTVSGIIKKLISVCLSCCDELMDFYSKQLFFPGNLLASGTKKLLIFQIR